METQAPWTGENRSRSGGTPWPPSLWAVLAPRQPGGSDRDSSPIGRRPSRTFGFFRRSRSPWFRSSWRPGVLANLGGHASTTSAWWGKRNGRVRRPRGAG